MCDTCGKGFTYARSLKVHHSIHTGDKPYVCNTCRKVFAQKGSLKRHQNVHIGDKPILM